MPTQQQADNLNDRFDQMADKLDLLDSVPISKARQINYTISDWQDYYWGPGVDTAFSQLVSWEQRYIAAAQTLDSVASQTISKKRVEDTEWYKADAAASTGAAPVKLPPLLIYGTPPPAPPRPYVAPPPVVYRPDPLPPLPSPPPVVMTMEPIDTTEWGRVTPQEAQIYARAPANAPWQVPEMQAPTGKGGLLAAVVLVVAGIYGNRAGWF